MPARSTRASFSTWRSSRRAVAGRAKGKHLRRRSHATTTSSHVLEGTHIEGSLGRGSLHAACVPGLDVGVVDKVVEFLLEAVVVNALQGPDPRPCRKVGNAVSIANNEVLAMACELELQSSQEALDFGTSTLHTIRQIMSAVLVVEAKELTLYR